MVDESFWMICLNGLEDELALCSSTIVDHVVPREEQLAESAAVLNGSEAMRELGSIPQSSYNSLRRIGLLKRVVSRERNKSYYRVLHVPIWIWAFWVLPGNLTVDLYAHGPDRRHWVWLAIVTAVCTWRGFAGRLPGVEPCPYITHYGEDKPNLSYRIVCYPTAWIALLVPFTINLTGLLINFFTGKWMIQDLFTRLYYVLAVVIVIATILDITPRARRSTRGEGAEKAWFYVTVWMVVPTQLASWVMWRMGRYFKLSSTSLDHLRLITFMAVSGAFLILGLRGKLPRTLRYHIPKGVISDVPVSSGV